MPTRADIGEGSRRHDADIRATMPTTSRRDLTHRHNIGILNDAVVGRLDDLGIHLQALLETLGRNARNGARRVQSRA